MGAYEVCLAITGKHPYRQYPKEGLCWVVGLDFNMVRDIDLPKFEKFLPKQFDSGFSKADRIWECEGEGRHWRVQFKSSDSGRAKFQGAKVDCIWFDEEPDKIEIFNECMMRLIDRRGVWWMTATPILGSAWLKALSEQDDVYMTTGTMWDNPYLPEAEIRREAEKLPEEERLVRIEGQYIVFGGRPVFRSYIQALNQRLQALKKEPSPLIGHIETFAA